MAIYVVMESGRSDAEGMPEVVYVRDGFSFIAFLLPALWLLWHRLWIEALLALAVTLCLGSFGALAGLSPFAVTLLSLLIGIYVGLEGPALRIAALRRRGWREWGVVRAHNRGEAEMRHAFEAYGQGHAEAGPAHRQAMGEPWARSRTAGPAMGLLEYPGGR